MDHCTALASISTAVLTFTSLQGSAATHHIYSISLFVPPETTDDPDLGDDDDDRDDGVIGRLLLICERSVMIIIIVVVAATFCNLVLERCSVLQRSSCEA